MGGGILYIKYSLLLSLLGILMHNDNAYGDKDQNDSDQRSGEKMLSEEANAENYCRNWLKSS